MENAKFYLNKSLLMISFSVVILISTNILYAQDQKIKLYAGASYACSPQPISKILIFRIGRDME